MYKITISDNVNNAVDWAMNNLEDADWDLNFVVEQGFITPTYAFSFSKLESASHFALKWKGV
jgi:hypothetical protein